MPSNATDLRLSIGPEELSVEKNGEDLLNEHAKHISQAVVLFRVQGGSDCYPQLQFLHNEGIVVMVSYGYSSLYEQKPLMKY